MGWQLIVTATDSAIIMGNTIFLFCYLNYYIPTTMGLPFFALLYISISLIKAIVLRTAIGEKRDSY